MKRRFWPVAEAAQVDYETLREGALSGIVVLGPAAGRFERAGLAGLIDRPSAPPVFGAVLVGAERPAWSPYADPRTQALVETYQLLIATAVIPGVEAVS
ncbi:MAG TPA: hypothetical protein VNF50_01740 [Acidimicrobiales bacterium]|nr:hypothetical protein [Acidimicrobiales bacterium]